ncbi:hypothetical protein [Nocardia harenae]|uniref:hypothetical protein n=1 Tax=Nocardia harenae TaxID=358707 RepID=UPI00082F7352|nr:hypothetical protein [Nocardia harenae]
MKLDQDEHRTVDDLLGGGVATVVAPDEPRALPGEPEGDDALAARFALSGLRRLMRNAAGLSPESIDLLAAITDRLRAAEGALADPATCDTVR